MQSNMKIEQLRKERKKLKKVTHSAQGMSVLKK